MSARNPPGSDGRDLAVRQESDDPAPLQIAHDAAVAMISAPRPVVDADDVQRRLRQLRPFADDTQERIIADRHHQSPGEAGGRSATQRQPEMMNETFETRRSPGTLGHHLVLKPLREDASPTERCLADKTAGRKPKLDFPADAPQIGDGPDVSAVDAAGEATAERALPTLGSRPCRNDHHPFLLGGTLDNQSGRDQGRQTQDVRHDADSLVKQRESAMRNHRI